MRAIAWLPIFVCTCAAPLIALAQNYGWTCRPKCIDAGVTWTGKKVYLFKGSEYLRYSGDDADDGYPLPIAGNWPGFPDSWSSSGIDAAINWHAGKVFFFKGGEYLRYNMAAGTADPGYPRPIAGNWRGFPAAWASSGIDAAVNWGDGKVYFFKGGNYLRYNIAEDGVAPGYPRSIAGNWPGFPRAWSSGIDAAVNWEQGKVYFFKGDRYLRYDIAQDRVDAGFPRPVAGNWAGFAEPPSRDLNETIAKLPVTVTGLNGITRTGDIIVTHYRPGGRGPFPTLVYSQGRQPYHRAWPARRREVELAKFWLGRGFAFLIATRLGYGATGLDPDVEQHGGCERANYAPGARAAASQAIAVAKFASALPFVDRKRIVFAGNSTGGLAMIVASGMDVPDGVIAAINYAGGAGGNVLGPARPCNEPDLRRVVAEAGASARIPMLWLYSRNDSLWGPDLPRAWHKAFTTSGGTAELHLLPPVGEEGHDLIDYTDAWELVVRAYLAKLGAPLSRRR